MTTARLNLPLLSPGQAQKELFHNEALQTLDLLVAAAVEDGPITAPPASPLAGQCFIVGAGATGDWAGRDTCLAGYTAGGWRFITPVEGMTTYVRAKAVDASFRGGSWELGLLKGSEVLIGGKKVVGERAAAILSPTGGATVDVEARDAVGQILAALRQHGLVET